LGVFGYLFQSPFAGEKNSSTSLEILKYLLAYTRSDFCLQDYLFFRFQNLEMDMKKTGRSYSLWHWSVMLLLNEGDKKVKNYKNESNIFNKPFSYH